MKKTSIIILLAIAFLNSNGQYSEKFLNAMKANISALDTSFRNPSSLAVVSNNFERVALAEKNQWLPYYYAAYSQVVYAFMNTDKTKTDAIADKADLLISKADSLMPGNSEISCIKSMIASCRLMVNPMERYMQYGPASAAALEAAIAQDASNPRPYLLQGQSLKYTPEQFGGGCSKAMTKLEVAKEKFVAFKPVSEIAPHWGNELNERLISECK